MTPHVIDTAHTKEPSTRAYSAPAQKNRFATASTDSVGWHAHDTGQFILVESGSSQLQTEFGTCLIPAGRIAWVPPSVQHSSNRTDGRGWVVIPPLRLGDLPAHACVLRASPLLLSALQRITQLQPHDRLAGLLWEVIGEELRGATPEAPAIPLPSSARLLKAARMVLASPTVAFNLDNVARFAGMSRRSFARHFHSQTGMSFARWSRAVIAQHALGISGLRTQGFFSRHGCGLRERERLHRHVQAAIR